MPSLFRRMLSRWQFWTTLAVLALAGSAWYVHWRGGWANTLRLPPLVDASTPRAQNGFTLLDVQLPGDYQGKYGRKFSGFQYGDVAYQTFGNSSADTEDAFGIWIKPSTLTANLKKAYAFPVQFPNMDINSESSVFGKAFSFTAKLSIGDIVPLQWRLRGLDWPQESDTEKKLLFVSLPTGYSNACRFVDITASDLSGHTATWRITRLPQMRHVIPSSPKITDSVTKDGITMSAQAWNCLPWHGQLGLITYILRPVLPPNSHQWDVGTIEVSQEREPFGYDGHSRYSFSNDEIDGTPIIGRNGIFNTGFERWYGGGILAYAGNDYYPRMNRFLRLTAELRQYETYDEKVTFHNVDIARYDDPGEPGPPNFYIITTQPQFITTPSRVAVTLLPRQTGPHLFNDTEGGRISLKLLMLPEAKLNMLPSSPLCKTYGKPVRLQIIIPPPFEANGWSNAPGPEHNISLWPSHLPTQSVKDWPKVTPQHLSTFTVIVRQRVEIQTIPMTFTLPIADQAPPYYPKGYQPPKRR